MYEFVINIMNQFGYIGVLLLIAIENIFPPIPSEVILLFGGFMVTYSNLNLIFMIVFSTIGSLLGALVLYYLGMTINKEKMKKMVSGKSGKILRLKPDDIENASVWFNNKGYIGVFIGRFFPIIRSLISIPAGMGKMNLFKFVLYTILGSIVWNALLLFLGYKMGSNWDDILIYFNQYRTIAMILLGFVIFSLIFVFYYKNRKKERQG